MTGITLDAGGLIALDRNDRRVIVLLARTTEGGMRITVPMVLMSTRDFGDWTGYLPRNPGFM